MHCWLVYNISEKGIRDYIFNNERRKEGRKLITRMSNLRKIINIVCKKFISRVQFYLLPCPVFFNMPSSLLHLQFTLKYSGTGNEILCIC